MGVATHPVYRGATQVEVEQFYTSKHKLGKLLSIDAVHDIAHGIRLAGKSADFWARDILQAIAALESEISSGRRIELDHNQYETIVKRWLNKHELALIDKGFTDGDRALIQVTLSDALLRWLKEAQKLYVIIEAATEFTVNVVHNAA